MIDPLVFNTQRDYEHQGASLFLGDAPGLLDSINKPHAELWKLYKQLKKLDWDENEFQLSKCRQEFLSAPKSISDKMINTLAWQWEADSCAAHSVAAAIAPFVTSDEAWAVYVEINKNEILHALSYSEIVKNSFDNPSEVMRTVLENQNSLRRMKTVGNALGQVKRTGARLTLGLIDKQSDEAIDAALLFLAAMLILERCQFMASFAITFAIGETGLFMPIVDTVQKICTDEYTVHVPVGKYAIQNEQKVPRSIASFKRIEPTITRMIEEVVASELNWTQAMFEDTTGLAGVTEGMIMDWVHFGANDVYRTFGMANPGKIVAKNPLLYMNRWIDINQNQGSPQEKKGGNYLLGGIVSSGSTAVHDISDL